MNEFPPLPIDRVQQLADPDRNGPIVVRLALEVLAARKWFRTLPEDLKRQLMETA